jgi:cysteine-rich repeat protein
MHRLCQRLSRSLATNGRGGRLAGGILLAVAVGLAASSEAATTERRVARCTQAIARSAIRETVAVGSARDLCLAGVALGSLPASTECRVGPLPVELENLRNQAFDRSARGMASACGELSLRTVDAAASCRLRVDLGISTENLATCLDEDIEAALVEPLASRWPILSGPLPADAARCLRRLATAARSLLERELTLRLSCLWRRARTGTDDTDCRTSLPALGAAAENGRLARRLRGIEHRWLARTDTTCQRFTALPLAWPQTCGGMSATSADILSCNIQHARAAVRSLVDLAYPLGVTCGDLVLGPDEECDTGPDNSDVRPNACRRNCQLPYCGDGIEDSGEACDDGNTADGDSCTSSCEIFESCGDGLLQTELGEECDDGPGNAYAPDACRPTCQLPRCGDRILDSGEECERDHRLCQIDSGCVLCGNGVIGPGEECDDGIDNSDGVPDACPTDCRYD